MRTQKSAKNMVAAFLSQAILIVLGLFVLIGSLYYILTGLGVI